MTGTALAGAATLATVRLVAWGNAALEGRTSLDDAAEAAADGARHRVRGLPTETTEVSLAYGLGRLRTLGVTWLRAVLPAPGDAAGLPGPAAVNQVAVQAGGIVVAVAASPLGLLPAVSPAGIVWSAVTVAGTGEGPLADLSQADRELTEALAATTEELARLGVARWRPELAEAMRGLRAATPIPLPPGHPHRAVRVAAQAARLLTVVDIAGADDGAAISGPEIRARSQALAHLRRAARRALAAAATGR